MSPNKTTFQNASVAKKSATRFAMLVSFSVLATLGLMYALQLILNSSALHTALLLRVSAY